MNKQVNTDKPSNKAIITTLPNTICQFMQTSQGSKPSLSRRTIPTYNPLGIKGVGEIGIVGVAAAVANAVYHATGKRVRDLPITPDKLL